MAVKRRKFIRIISYLMAVCLVFAVTGFLTQRAKGSYEQTLERVRFESLNSLCEYIRELSGGLSLLAVSSGESVADSAAYVCSRAIGAIGCTACFDSEKIKNISSFLNNTYDFAENFNQNESNSEAAIAFSDYAEKLYYHLSDISNAVMNGVYSLSEYPDIYSRDSLPYFEDYLDFESVKENESVSFTARMKKSMFLSEKSDISEEKARKKAEKTANISSVLWRNSGVSEKYSAEIYSFSHGDVYVEISKAGGVLCRFINPKPCGEKHYSMNAAFEKAKAFLKKEGFDDMRAFSENEGVFSAIFIFVPEVNGVLLLNSLVRIEVCLASGEITFFDAGRYVENYRTDVYSSGVSPDLSSLIPENMRLQSTVLCLADIDERERLCYVAVCLSYNKSVLVFIDSSSFKIYKTQITDFSLLI